MVVEFVMRGMIVFDLITLITAAVFLITLRALQRLGGRWSRKSDALSPADERTRVAVAVTPPRLTPPWVGGTPEAQRYGRTMGDRHMKGKAGDLVSSQAQPDVKG